MKPELKKLLILNAPYLLFVYLFDKIGQAVRLAPGADLSGKVLSLADGFSAAFATPLPSLAPMDLLIGIAGAVLIRLIVYFKGNDLKFGLNEIIKRLFCREKIIFYYTVMRSGFQKLSAILLKMPLNIRKKTDSLQFVGNKLHYSLKL